MIGLLQKYIDNLRQRRNTKRVHGCGSGLPSNTWFPGPTQLLNPNGISIGSAVFAGLTSVTDRPTDHATRSVTIDRIYVRSTAMRSNNNILTANDMLIYKAKSVSEVSTNAL